MSLNVFDIEAGGLGDDELRSLCPPVKQPEHPGEFDPDDVKLGNMTDPNKIEAKIQKCRLAHEKAVTDYESDCRRREGVAFAEFKEDAALDPITGRVLAIGYMNVDNGKYILDVGEEAELLGNFWQHSDRMRSQNRQMAGHYIFQYDLPFIINRSRILGVDHSDLFELRGSYCNFDRMFVDTHPLWKLGRQKSKASLNVICQATGGPTKPEDTTGADFAELLKTDPDRALAYLKNDLDMTAWVVKLLGLA